jgi:hypothetical protein
VCGIGVSDRFKEECKSEAFKAWLCGPFNPRYMDFTTTTGKGKISWRQGVKPEVHSHEWRVFKIRAHEGQHMVDWDWLKWVYGLPHLLAGIALLGFIAFGGWWAVACLGCLIASLLMGYIMPTKPWWFLSWAAIGVLTCMAGAIYRTGWQSMWVAGAALLLSPALNWLGAAWGRAVAELRGYSISLAVDYWKYGSIKHDTLEWIIEHFTSGDYYWMLPWKNFVRTYFEKQIKRLGSGEFRRGLWPSKVFAAMDEAQLVAPSVRK